MLSAEKSRQRRIYVTSSGEHSHQASYSVPCQRTNAPHAAPTTAVACRASLPYGNTSYHHMRRFMSLDRLYGCRVCHYCEMIVERNGHIGYRSRPCCVAALVVVHEQLYGAEVHLVQPCRGQGRVLCMSQINWTLGSQTLISFKQQPLFSTASQPSLAPPNAKQTKKNLFRVSDLFFF